MKPKPIAPKDCSKELSAKTVGQLKKLLEEFDENCNVYSPYDESDSGDIEVWRGKQVFARIKLTGY